MTQRIIDDATLLTYFASVVSAVRQPFGRRSFHIFPAGAPSIFELASNAADGHVIAVTVTRADLQLGVTVPGCIFTQQQGAAASSDYGVAFAPTGQHRFVLKHGESLSLQSPGTTAMQVVVAQETY